MTPWQEITQRMLISLHTPRLLLPECSLKTRTHHTIFDRWTGHYTVALLPAITHHSTPQARPYEQYSLRASTNRIIN